jgi:radical SAM superfamily enzyme YgiQ (UPF0313 family)
MVFHSKFGVRRSAFGVRLNLSASNEVAGRYGTLPSVADIVLTTFNARYAHAAFGLRYLMANMGALAAQTAILEFEISHRPVDALETILLQSPRIVGIGVYIWNVTVATQLVAELKRIRPDVIVVLGGPEVSHETDQQEICRLADYVITGEADLAFAALCEKLLGGRRPLMKIIPAELPEFSRGTGDGSGNGSAVGLVRLPYDLYTDEDLKQRVVYVEASRGCPFKCEFCLSSLDVPVRNVDLESFLSDMDRLLSRGLNQFKFVDRTFNLNLNISKAILQFFLARLRPGLFLHFEMIPDRLPEALRELIAQFPAGVLQFEVGIQTFNSEVARLISRRQDYAKLADNLAFLRQNTGVHVHADLIIGLPGEDVASFAAGFDQLVAMKPQEIQVGVLKRLRGTPIVRHDAQWGMVFSPHPPYEILQTKLIDFATMQRLRRFSRYWDLIANSGNFVATTPVIWGDESPFKWFFALADWLFIKAGKSHAISLHRLMELLLEFLSAERGVPIDAAAAVIWQDYQRGGRSDRPGFLAPYVEPADTRVVRNKTAPARQARFLAS